MNCPRCGFRNIPLEGIWAYCSYCDSEFQKSNGKIQWIAVDLLYVGDVDIFDIWDDEEQVIRKNL